MWPPAPWPGLPMPVAPAARPSRTAVVLDRARHRSFTAGTARALVAPLSRREVRRLWSVTGRLLAESTTDADRLDLDVDLDVDLVVNLVVLREQLLDRLEPEDCRR